MVRELPVKNGFIIPLKEYIDRNINYSDQVSLFSKTDTIYSLYEGMGLTQFKSNGGWFLLIKDSTESVTCYGNLREIEVKEGQSIKKGDIIGFSCASKEYPNLFELKFFLARGEALLNYFERIDFFKCRE